jgi:hypothetical protein
MLVVTVLIISLILQYLAVYFLFRLIRGRGTGLGWSLIAVAITLMALRCGVSAGQMFIFDTSPCPGLAIELIALAISALMVLGIERITPIDVGSRGGWRPIRALRGDPS